MTNKYLEKIAKSENDRSRSISTSVGTAVGAGIGHYAGGYRGEAVGRNVVHRAILDNTTSHRVISGFGNVRTNYGGMIGKEGVRTAVIEAGGKLGKAHGSLRGALIGSAVGAGTGLAANAVARRLSKE